MNKTLFFALILLSTISFSQAPQYLNYQGVARNSSGTIITSGNIGIQFEILQGSASGPLIYSEENFSAPSTAGIFTTAIGSGSNTTGTFSSINWAGGPYFIRVSIDPAGGTAFSAVGTSQLLSVPYALYAETAGNIPNFTAGNGISITSGTITNSSPNQTVNVSGPNVTGTYPNYTVTAGSTYTSGAGISISSGSIINTAPDQTITLASAGISSVTGSYPTFTIDVPAPSLNYNSGTQELTLTQGTVVTTATITTSSTSVGITGPGISGSYPNYTITPPPATSITAGNSNIIVTGSEPNFTISSVPSLSLVGAQLSISNGNTVTLPTGTTYTNGAGISLTSGTVITNTAQDQTVIISNGTNVTVNSAYPNFTINATPTLSFAANVLSISGGNAVTLPSPPVLTPGAGISIISGTISNTAPNQTVNVSGPNVIGAYPNYTVTAISNPIIVGAGATTVTTAGNSYTVNTPPVNLAFMPNSGILSYTPAVGSNTINISPALTFTNAILTVGSNTVLVPGTGLWVRPTTTTTSLSNINDFVGIGTTTPSERLQVQSGGSSDISIVSTALNSSNLNFGTNANHFLGQINYNSNTNNMSITSNSIADRLFFEFSGNTGIGNNAPVSELDVTGSLRLSGSRLFLGAVGGVNSGYTGIYENGGDLRFAVFDPGAGANPPFASGGKSIDGMIIQNTTGNVGIGTIAPSNALEVYRNGSGNTATLWLESATVDAATNAGVILKNGVNRVDIWHDAAGTSLLTNVPTGYKMLWRINNIDKMVLDASGNIGIGTTSPLAKLDIVSNSFDLLNLTTTGVNSNVNVDASPTGVGVLQIRTPAANGISFVTNNIARMLIDGGGNVGIGTGSPAYPFHVQKSASGIFAASIENTSSTGWGLEVRTLGTAPSQSAFEVYTGGLSKFLVREDGFVGIGTSSSPTHKLSVDHLPLSATDVQIKTFNSSAAVNSKSGIRFETGGAWAVQLQTSNGNNWLELTNNVGSVVSAWSNNRYYPGNPGTGVYLEGTAGSLNLMGGNVGIGTAAPTAQLEVNQYTKLGSTAPAIQMKKLVGTTASTAGSGVSIVHGLTYSKILSVVVMVEDVIGTQMIPPNWGPAGYQYMWDLSTTAVNVYTFTGNSANVLSKPIKILITYEQ